VTDEYAVIAAVYDLWSAPMADDIPFYVAEAVRSGGPVLEVGVGTGRVAAAVARAGIDVVGVDVSPAMLARARDRLERDGVGDRVELIEGDMRRLDLPAHRFPLAMMPYRVLAHALTVEDQLATLRGVRDHLVPGGRLVFNLPVPRADELAAMSDGLRREGRFPLDGGGEAILWRQADYEPASQLLHFRFVVEEVSADGVGGRRVHGDSTVRQCSPGEIEHALARAELDLVERWGWFDRRPFEAHSGEMVIVAAREDSWRRAS